MSSNVSTLSNIEEMKSRRQKEYDEEIEYIIKNNPKLFSENFDGDISKVVVKTKKGDKRLNQFMEGPTRKMLKGIINEERKKKGLRNLESSLNISGVSGSLEGENKRNITGKVAEIKRKLKNGDKITVDEWEDLVDFAEGDKNPMTDTDLNEIMRRDFIDERVDDPDALYERLARGQVPALDDDELEILEEEDIDYNTKGLFGSKKEKEIEPEGHPKTKIQLDIEEEEERYGPPAQVLDYEEHFEAMLRSEAEENEHLRSIIEAGIETIRENVESLPSEEEKLEYIEDKEKLYLKDVEDRAKKEKDVEKLNKLEERRKKLKEDIEKIQARQEEFLQKHAKDIEEARKNVAEGSKPEELSGSFSEKEIGHINRNFFDSEWEDRGSYMYNKTFGFSISKEAYDKQLNEHKPLLDTVEQQAIPSGIGALVNEGVTVATGGNIIAGTIAGGLASGATRLIEGQVQEESSSPGTISEREIIRGDSPPPIVEQGSKDRPEGTQLDLEEETNAQKGVENIIKTVLGYSDQQQQYIDNSQGQGQVSNDSMTPGSGEPDKIIKEALEESKMKQSNEPQNIKKLVTYTGAIHKDAIELFFGSSKRPNWNWTLFAGRTLNWKTPKGKKYIYMQNKYIFKNYGPDMFVYSLRYTDKSKPEDVYKENYELMQLYFALTGSGSKNIQLNLPGLQNSSSDLVQVKLSDLLKEHNILSHDAISNYNNFNDISPKNNVVSPQLIDEIKVKLEKFDKRSTKIFSAQKIPKTGIIKFIEDPCDNKVRNKIIRIKNKFNI